MTSRQDCHQLFLVTKKGEFRMFFEIPLIRHDQKQKYAILTLQLVSLDSYNFWEHYISNKSCNVQTTASSSRRCNEVLSRDWKMTEDVARSNGIEEFFICDTSSMNTDSLVSPTYPVDLTVRQGLTSMPQQSNSATWGTAHLYYGWH